jgi:hypothetical protein
LRRNVLPPSSSRSSLLASNTLESFIWRRYVPSKRNKILRRYSNRERYAS